MMFFMQCSVLEQWNKFYVELYKANMATQKHVARSIVSVQEWFLAGAESLGRGGSGQDAEVHGGE